MAGRRERLPKSSERVGDIKFNGTMAKFENLKSPLFDAFSGQELSKRQMLFLGGGNTCNLNNGETWSADTCNNSQGSGTCADGTNDDAGGTCTCDAYVGGKTK